MSTKLTQLDQAKGGMIEQVLIKGDLSSLTSEQRSNYYLKVCESVGLNMLTKPFEYITLNGKLTFYALRSCTDQLRSIHKVSVEDMAETEREGVFIVTAKVRNGEGRTDIAKGAVNIKGLSGEALANALMKAETKAKRRATLSICGLGMLDETEVETIPGVVTGEPVKNRILPYDLDDSKPKSIFKNGVARKQYQDNMIDAFTKATTVNQLNEIIKLEIDKFALFRDSGDERDQMLADYLQNTYKVALVKLKEPVEEVKDFIEEQMEAEKIFNREIPF